MNNIKIMQSIEIRMHVQNYVLRSIYEQTGLFLADENNTEEEDKTASAAIVEIVPDEITRLLMNLAKLPAIEDRNY